MGWGKPPDREDGERLARIESKIDGLAADDTRAEVRLNAQSARLDRIERFLWVAIGSGLSGGLPAIAQAFKIG